MEKDPPLTEPGGNVAFGAEMAFRDCTWCGLRHAQMIVGGTQEVLRAKGSRRYWTTVYCPECAAAMLIEHNADSVRPNTEYRVVPVGADAEVVVKNLPTDVGDYYRDAIRVLRADVPDAAAVQLRRTLEAAAARYEIEEKVLVKSIQKLIDDGHVTKSFGGALHHVRLLGNMGAHHTDQRVDPEAAARALRFTTALLRNLFEVPAELEALSATANGDSRDNTQTLNSEASSS